MKKLLATLCAVCLLMIGCGGDNVADKPSNNFSGDVVKIGMLTHLNSTEESLGEILSNIEDETGTKTKRLPKFYDNLKLMQMGIEAGNVESISTYQSVANYFIANNDKFELVQHDALNKIRDSFCFAVRKEDT